MKLHYLQHVVFEGLGMIEEWAHGRGAQVSCTRLFNGDPLPIVFDMDLLVIVGGPMSVSDEDEFPWLRAEKEFLRAAVQSSTRILGICLGAQLLAEVLGGRVYKNQQKEIGWFPIEVVSEESPHPITAILNCHHDMFHWHGDTFTLPPHAVHLARSAACENQAFAFGNNVLGLQFHPEMTTQIAQDLVSHCEYEFLTPSLSVQNPHSFMRDMSAFAAMKPTMFRCLDWIVDR